MILNGEDPVFWLHPTTCSAEDSEGQENDPRLTLATRPSLRQVFIPVPNSNEAAAASVAPPTRDLSSSSSLGRSTRDPTSDNNDIRRNPSSSESNISGFTRSSGQFGSMAEAASSSSSCLEQVENDDPFPTLVLAPPQQQRGSGGRLGNGRRISSDPEVCELFRESSSDVRVTTMRCGGERGSKVAGFQRWQRKVEGQRSVGGPTLLASSSSKTFGGDHVVPGRYRGQLRDLNVIQRPSLDFDKMQRYCLTRVHPTRGISKPRIVKVKCLPGSTSSFSSLGRVIRSELLDPSIFSFRSISQNPSITSSSSSRRSSATTPSLSDEN